MKTIRFEGLQDIADVMLALRRDAAECMERSKGLVYEASRRRSLIDTATRLHAVCLQIEGQLTASEALEIARLPG
jgi:hypothetical protein